MWNISRTYAVSRAEIMKTYFKILKEEKLKLDTAKEEADLVDGGLRYDLTVPLKILCKS